MEDGYPHVTMLKDVGPPDIELLKSVQQLEPEGAQGDCKYSHLLLLLLLTIQHLLSYPSPLVHSLAIYPSSIWLLPSYIIILLLSLSPISVGCVNCIYGYAH